MGLYTRSALVQHPEQQLDKAPRGKNGEKKSEEQLVLDGDTTREEICNGIKGCKKFKPEMKGCGSCEFCLPRAAFEVRNSLIDINWEDPGAPKEQVLMKEDLNFFDYDNWIDVRKRVKGADSSYNLTLQPITHSAYCIINATPVVLTLLPHQVIPAPTGMCR